MSGDLQSEVERLINEAYRLLGDTIEATRPSDLKAKTHKTRWWNRHRLHVLLDIAEKARQRLSRNIVVEPWFLAEFKATIEVIDRWKENPKWKDIEPPLKDKDCFSHTISKLRVAEHFMKSKHKVEIVPRGKDASPDLKVQAIGGTQDWLYVECYQPNALAGKPKDILETTLAKIVSRSMTKAKRQFEKRHPGILAVFGYNQSKSNFRKLIRRITDRLDKTDRPYLAGFLVMLQNVLFKRSDKRISFTPILSVEFISNPSYFGRIDIVSDIQKEIDTLQGQRRRIPKSRLIKEIRLNVIDEPKPMSRVILRGQGDEHFPFFKGQGNIDFLCGNCRNVLADHIWKLSVSNLVILCPSCNCYNEIPRVDKLKYPLKGIIAIEKGIYDFSTWVHLTQGAIIRGR